MASVLLFIEETAPVMSDCVAKFPPPPNSDAVKVLVVAPQTAVVMSATNVPKLLNVRPE